MNSHKNYRFHITLIRTSLFLLCAFFVVITRLWQLQITEYESWKRLSDKNQFKNANVAPTRGHILDRNHKPLAVNRPQINLTTLYTHTHALQKLQQALSDILHIQTPKIATKLLKPRARLTVLTELSQERIEALFQHSDALADAELTTDSVRTYPCGHACAAVLGYTRNEHDDAAGIQRTVGVGGVEQNYQELLSGSHGQLRKQRDAKGNLSHAEQMLAPSHGADIVLSVDLRIQRILHKHLKGLKGAVIVSNPHSGEILGLYSAPSFDPNLLVERSDSKALTKLFNDPTSPMLNRVTQGLFPPASTVKPFLSLYALNHNLITPQDVIYDPGFYRYKNTSYTYHNWLRSGHGSVDLHKALVVSNDTYFYELGMKIGIDHISKALNDFQFQTPTYIDLPGEKTGFVPSRQHHNDRGRPWLIGETLISVIGQGENLVTPISLARAINLLATQGRYARLHLLKAIWPHGHTTPTPTPQKKPVAVTETIPKAHWQRVHKAMLDVAKKGTGVKFQDFPYSIAAKTGTAQIVRGSNKHTQKHQKDHSWFMGFTPADSAKLSIVVLIENENTATLYARAIMNELLELDELWQ